MNNRFLFFFFSIMLISCSSKNNQQELSLDGAYYTIDLDAEKEDPIPLSSLFKSVRTVILETGEDFLIGNISTIHVFDGHIYILDSRKAKGLYVFDMEGRFIRKIGGLGQGPGEYLEPADFTLDTNNGIIYICDMKNRVHKYNLDGTFIHTITIQAPNSTIAFIQFYNDNLYSSHIWWDKTSNDSLLLEIDPNDGKILSQSLHVKYNKGWNESFFNADSRFFMSRAQNPPRFNQMFMDHIVSIGKEITPYIELKSKYLTTEADIESFRGKDGIPANTSNVFNSKKKFSVTCFIENDDFVSFQWGLNRFLSVVLDKKTGKAKLYDYMNNDLIYKQGQKNRSQMHRFKCSDAKGAYVILETLANELSNFQNDIKNNEIVPDLDKLEQLKQLDDDSNPVIFFYEYK